MSIFFVNTDAVSSNGISYHDEWIRRGIVVTGGAPRYRQRLSEVRRGDSVLVYVNGMGVVAVGVALDDQILDVTDQETVNPAEKIEYHKRVEWQLDLRKIPIERAELSRLLGQGPVQAVQRVNQGEEKIFEKLRSFKSEPTADIHEYVRLANSLLQRGRIERPRGIDSPRRTECSTGQFYRDPTVRAWTLQRANGCCEMCLSAAPFLSDGDFPYLESHHIVTLADGGPDSPENTAALCPNCHRDLHFGVSRLTKSKQLRQSISAKEAGSS